MEHFTWTGFLAGILTALVPLLGALAAAWVAVARTRHMIKTGATKDAVAYLSQIIDRQEDDLKRHGEQIRSQQKTINDLWEEATECHETCSEQGVWIASAHKVLKRVAPGEVSEPPARREPKLKNEEAETQARHTAQGGQALEDSRQRPPRPL